MKWWEKTGHFAKGAWKKGGFYALAALGVLTLGTGAYMARQSALGRGGLSETLPTPAPAALFLDERLEDVRESPLIWPVSGREVLTPHSPQELLWSDTLSMYAAHAGVDIAAVRGETVVCAMDGRVTAAYADPLLGYTIELTHENGIVTRYANLSTLRLVQAGQRVSRGEIIGAVGDSASCEAELPAHLHFEAYENGAWLALPLTPSPAE